MSSRIHDIQAAAEALHQARSQRKPIPRVSEQFGIEGLEGAYAVAALNTERALAAGRRLSGCKIGLTSAAVQQQLGVDQPDYGVLFGDMEFLDGDELPAGRLLQPKAEGEVAFVIGRDLDDPELCWARLLHAIEGALPALEIVDSAIEDWRITLVDTVADNASSGLYVLGTELRTLGSLELGSAGMELRHNGRIASVGSGAACMGHPLRAMLWLARTMARLGQPLRAGDVVMSGALGPMVPLRPGDDLDLSIAGLGRVRCRAG